jgi:hypothetical protein
MLFLEEIQKGGFCCSTQVFGSVSEAYHFGEVFFYDVPTFFINIQSESIWA